MKLRLVTAQTSTFLLHTLDLKKLVTIQVTSNMTLI